MKQLQRVYVPQFLAPSVNEVLYINDAILIAIFTTTPAIVPIDRIAAIASIADIGTNAAIASHCHHHC